MSIYILVNILVKNIVCNNVYPIHARNSENTHENILLIALCLIFFVINVWKFSLNALLSVQRMLKGENDNFVNKIGSYVMNQRLCCPCKNLNEFRLYSQST